MGSDSHALGAGACVFGSGAAELCSFQQVFQLPADAVRHPVPPWIFGQVGGVLMGTEEFPGGLTRRDLFSKAVLPPAPCKLAARCVFPSSTPMGCGRELLPAKLWGLKSSSVGGNSVGSFFPFLLRPLSFLHPSPGGFEAGIRAPLY